MLLKHDLSKLPGRWRLGPINVVDEARGEVVFEGPDVEEVPALVDRLAAGLDADETSPTVVRAAMAHLNLVMIHPFRDGNGRMARCLQTLVLARDRITHPEFSSIEEYLGRNTQAYYEVLAGVGGGAWRPDRDTRPWIRFCLTAHWRQAKTLEHRVDEIQKLWDALEARLERLGLPARALASVAEAAMGHRVRNSSYRANAEVSYSVATKDLKALVDAGLLQPRGERRGRSYVATEETAALGSAYRAAPRIADPFAGEGGGR
jgi:Fic family protein